MPLASEASIDFVISGHNHSYERLTRRTAGQTTHYIIVGGAGGGLDRPPYARWPTMDRVVSRHHFRYFEIAGDTLSYRAVTTDREMIVDTIVTQRPTEEVTSGRP